MKGYIEHLKASCKYWQQIAAAEREKNMKLEEIIKRIEKNIYGLDENKEERLYNRRIKSKS